MSRWKLILFDLDDTLHDFTRCWDLGMQEALRTHPFTRGLDGDRLFATFQHYNESLWHLYEEKKVSFNEYRRLRFAKTIGEFGLESSDEVADDFQRLFSEKNMGSITIKPELVAMMSELSQTYQLGIITNGPLDQSYNKVMRLGLARFFPEDSVFVSEEVGYHKPEPEIYLMALDHFGVTASDTLFVGDSWLHDVAGPIALGMQAIWINAKHGQPATEHQPLAVIERADELLGILQKVNLAV